MIKIVTHDRAAHADDAFAAAILRIIYGEVDVLRTRNPVILKKEAGQENTFFLDVGGRYDASLRLFDHHQPEGAGYRPKPPEAVMEWPYATAGLVWLHYGAQAVRAIQPSLSQEEVDEVVAQIDESMLKYVDAIDCGVRGLKSSGPSMSSIIASFNNSWYEEESDPFPLVMSLAQVILTNFIKRMASTVMARSFVRKSTLIEEGRVLVLDQCLPWSEVVAEEMPSVKVVLYPIFGQGAKPIWQLRVAVNPNRDSRMKFPSSWGGLDREALSAVCGVEDATFCHRALHLAGAGSYDGALKMCKLALQNLDQQQVLSANPIVENECGDFSDEVLASNDESLLAEAA